MLVWLQLGAVKRCSKLVGAARGWRKLVGAKRG
jgi:hypothetical protein